MQSLFLSLIKFVFHASKALINVCNIHVTLFFFTPRLAISKGHLKCFHICYYLRLGPTLDDGLLKGLRLLTTPLTWLPGEHLISEKHFLTRRRTHRYYY